MSCEIKNERCGFRCTGYEGSKVWEKLHKLPEEIDCEECSAHAKNLFKGIHDHVSVGLGKTPHDVSNYEKFVNEIICVYESCKKMGICH